MELSRPISGDVEAAYVKRLAVGVGAAVPKKTPPGGWQPAARNSIRQNTQDGAADRT
jgi:hypothetical protein